VPVAVAAVSGGVWPGLAAAADLLVNIYFVPPYHMFTVEHGDNASAASSASRSLPPSALAVDIAARQHGTAARRVVPASLSVHWLRAAEIAAAHASAPYAGLVSQDTGSWQSQCRGRRGFVRAAP
jgi:hypothetical protein